MGKLVLLLLLLGCAFSESTIISIGQCDQNITVVNNIDVAAYLGVWYEIARYPNAFQPGDCTIAEYIDTTSEIYVRNTNVNNERLESIEGRVEPASDDGSGKFLVTLNVAGTNQTGDYWVLATDYTDYALVYSCSNITPELKATSSWILSRTKTQTAAAAVAIDTAINSVPDSLNLTLYRYTDQSDEACFYYPELEDTNTPLVFPGQCDESLPVVMNFNLAAYLGRWYEIARYPEQFQTGECANAEYSLGLDGTVVVVNSQVNNDLLETIQGTAVVASTDGSAKLTVFFPIAGTDLVVNSSLWVLDTDYTSYALVYNCQNINEEQRQITSWKVSRTKELPTAANTAMNAIIDNVQGLREGYYMYTDQSDDACFYYPELGNTDASPVLPGQCDETIPVVMNFSAAAYLGMWHEIARYPQESQTGECANALYSLNNDSNVAVFNSIVNNERLETIEGVAVVASTDGSAKLTVTFPIPGTDIVATASYWVLDTDYTSYALVYSCRNINAEQRQISSWKLSRTKTLPAAANTAMDAIIQNVQGLNEDYYLYTNQSDAACFYYPELEGANTPLVFPGQCDESIPVVMNFSAGEYLGRWFEIARFPQEFQVGECAAAQYSFNNDSNVAVLNSIVYNERLETIEGVAVVASTDGSAKLTVTFPIPGTNFVASSSYWVLDTDYTSYALVYSCTNINEEQRRITSWKLSRTRNLPAAASTAMDTIIENVQGLREEYYLYTDQTDEACFYYPEVEDSDAPLIFPGQCDESIPVVMNFSAADYLGRWYEIARYPQLFQTGECADAQYSLNNDSNVAVLNSIVNNERLETIEGVAVVASTDGSAKLTVTFPITGTDFVANSNYWVLDTDYTSYALVYSCTNINDEQRQISSWKLSRTKNLPAAASTAIDAIIENVQGLREDYYRYTNQSDESCFYYPEVEGVNTPVVFPGQCDESIPVVMNFNASAYLGRWFEIARFPQEFQVGECADAQYSLNNDSNVAVLNSIVYNERLETIEGVAVVASTDGSAKLTVTFPIPGTDFEANSNYWVLDTDYTSYALVYSCRNINEDQRQVSSWKLSRTKDLPVAASTAMDNIIENVQVLREDYYLYTNQSDDACFYYPEVEDDNTPLVFPGQCDESIPVVMNFNASAYLGRWHEIARYPQLFQTGECADAQYSLNDDGSVAVLNSIVSEETLETVEGVAVVASTDGSAKLTVSFPIAGTDFIATASYWVLDTDYTSYALVYSCTNINAEQRQISSWKLSRTRNLPAAASTAMDTIIENVQGLREDYYLYTDQSDDACFYYPELGGANTPLVFPGQCDESIPVVMNFSAAEYLGRWHEIARYPQLFQTGECADAQYSLNDDGSVAVLNSIVSGETLETVEGVAVVASTDGSAKLTVSFPIAGTDFIANSNYWVLATDYTSYALVYSCTNINDEQRQISSWKLSRTKDLPAAASIIMDAIIEDVQGLREDYYLYTNQSDVACFYYPELDGANTPLIFPGQCDESIPVVMNFDASAYLGRWHEIARFPQVFQTGECADAQYSLNNDSNVAVLNSIVYNGRLETIEGVAVVASTDGSAKLTVTFPIPGTDFVATSSYWVLETDYTSYALVYSCTNINSDQRQVSSWKLSRTKELPAAANTTINAIVEDIQVLREDYYLYTDQSDDACFYYPEVEDANTPLVFPGQCDESIPVVTNFDAAAYLGLWYEIARYPQVFQTGECATAQYSLNDDGSVAVYNTIVNDEQLETIDGVAVVSSTDGSAKLTVSFPIAGTGLVVNSSYWVLDTDYTSYALVYSCQNINAEQRQISSWKLSRTKDLPAAANTAMDVVIENVQGLREDLFLYTDQSNDACFYYPEVEDADAPLLFPGQCDESLPVVNNFDAAAYLGRWHEIARYPQLFQTGECADAQYSLNGDGSVAVLNSIVSGETLETVEGVAVVVSTDGTAKLNVTFPIAGTDLLANSNYWVLDTDYTSYALVYSCRNVNAEQRQISSWKLSRTKNLPAAANAAMDAVIGNIQGLREDYYRYTNQSDEACFYYPELQGANTPIVFPGQCDESIPVVMNFDAEAYLGRWHEIARYPQLFQTGECADAQYSLNGDGSVAVLNSIVSGETLETVEGVAVVASTDGSAKLTVSFPIAGTDLITNSSYWVLDTDYTSYALVYSCTNINAEQRQISSWKLSRTKTLPAAASTAMDAIIENVQVLREDYYLHTEQSDDACFYYPPAFDDNSVVILPGQCDQNIPVVANFDVVGYTGTWYQIARYPEPWESGICTTAQYTLNEEAGFVEVVNSNFLNETIVVIEGTAVVASSDGSAKLTVTLPVVGTDLTTDAELWVLSTDYISYALAYSCYNIDSETRAVSSWKLSRTRSLPDPAAEIINSIVEQTVTLHEPYYVYTDQSEEICPSSAFAAKGVLSLVAMLAAFNYIYFKL